MKLFALNFDLLLIYIELSIGFWITRILKEKNTKIESFLPSADMTLDNIYIYIYIGIMVRVFANGLRYLGSIPGHVIPKTQKMVLDTPLLNTQHYKVRIKGKVGQSRENSSAFPYILV